MPVNKKTSRTMQYLSIRQTFFITLPNPTPISATKRLFGEWKFCAKKLTCSSTTQCEVDQVQRIEQYAYTKTVKNFIASQNKI